LQPAQHKFHIYFKKFDIFQSLARPLKMYECEKKIKLLENIVLMLVLTLIKAFTKTLS